MVLSIKFDVSLPSFPHGSSLTLKETYSPDAKLLVQHAPIFSELLMSKQDAEVEFKPGTEPVLPCRTAAAERDGNLIVYRGQLNLGNGDVSVVCKLGCDRHVGDLLTEARFYMEHLQGFQGTHVPRFYGLFHCETTYTSCLVLQDGGNPFDFTGLREELSIETREEIVRKLLELHKGGICHNQLKETPQHIVVSNNDTLFIDFKAAVFGRHTCALNGDLRRIPGLRKLEPEYLQCDEVHILCGNLDLWIPFYAPEAYDISVSVPSSKMLTFETLESFMKDKSPPMTEKDERRAKRLVERFRTRYAVFLNNVDWTNVDD